MVSFLKLWNNILLETNGGTVTVRMLPAIEGSVSDEGPEPFRAPMVSSSRVLKEGDSSKEVMPESFPGF